MAEYQNQSPVSWDKCSREFRKQFGAKEPTQIPEGFIAQAKYDGVSAVFDLHEGTVTSRVGTPLPAVEWMVNALRPVFCLDEARSVRYVYGELWLPGCSFPRISGLARKLTPQKLDLVVFDACRELDGRPYRERLRALAECVILARASTADDLADCFLHSPEHLTVPEGQTLQDVAEELVDRKRDPGGSTYDGLILRKLDAPWHQGKQGNGAVIKVKPVDTLDLPVTGGQAVMRDSKLGGYLTVEYRGVRTDVGSGLTQAVLTALLDNPDAYTGAVAEVAHIGVTKDGKLREPRLKGFRTDKATGDHD